jgi:hypothetical protein
LDLNYLFHRRQVELMRAADAACPLSAKAHRELAEWYTALIESERPSTPFPFSGIAESRGENAPSVGASQGD